MFARGKCLIWRKFHTRYYEKFPFYRLTGNRTDPSHNFDSTRTHCSSSEMKEATLKFVRLTKNASIPQKGSQHAAGYDLRSAYDYTITPHGKALCQTDLVIAVPRGTYGRIAPRSGLAHKNFIDVGAGVIDFDYRGNVGVILFNFSNEEFEVKKGDRIAQLICEKITYPEIEEVQTLDVTERGNGGYGSTGVH